jgi:hypothetical protein
MRRQRRRLCGLPATESGINLEETGKFALARGSVGADRGASFEEVSRFGEAFALEGGADSRMDGVTPKAGRAAAASRHRFFRPSD